MVDVSRNPKISKLTCGGDDGGGGGGRLGNLPESIVHHIFSFMETIDVVRTCLVSRKWRYLWLSCPYLSFDSQKICPNPHQRISEKFKDLVNWALLSQDGSNDVQRFRLSWCHSLDDCTDDRSIYSWINVMARRNVQELNLRVNLDKPFALPYCLVTSKSLVALKLHFDVYGDPCVLKQPSSCVGFSRLKSLKFVNVKLWNSSTTIKLILSSPVLENLGMHGCSFYDLNILDISSTSLRNLTLDEHDVLYSQNDLTNHKVKIACPNLVSLNFCPLSTPAEFTFGRLNSLQNAYVHVELDESSEHERIEMVKRFHAGLCDVKVLKITARLCECLRLLPPGSSFYNLESLIVGDCFKEWSIPSIISLLDRSPSLEALTIFFSWESEQIPVSVFLNSLSTHCLKTVELINFNGYESELQLVTFLLKHGHVLQKMIITWRESDSCVCREDVISRIWKFPSSSISVELSFPLPSSKSFFELFR